MSKIMFRGREVVEVKEHEESSCVCCVFNGMPESCPRPCKECLNTHTIYAYKQPVKKLTIFIEELPSKRAYFAGSIGKVDFSSEIYSTRRAAIRGAKRFCTSTGFECEVKK